MSRKYTHIKELLPEIKMMLEEGKTHREIEEFFHLQGDRPIHNLLKRERKNEAKIAAGLGIKRKGRPRKGEIKSEEYYKYEIGRLKMENELLRDFLRLVGRR